MQTSLGGAVKSVSFKQVNYLTRREMDMIIRCLLWETDAIAISM